ncbi:MAG: hypothetical protein IKI39_05155 [Oscillospiraceae bacterium]|nr:hypothetical protein [Oscillospiraceae bacterium]
MKRTVKTIIALALALTMICALGTTAFADSNTVVTKNPTDETRYVGETAIFIANAANYDSIEWLFIAPNGTQCKLDAFKTQFPGCTVTGQGTTELHIANLQTGLNGWKVFCCFGLNGKATTTSAASVNVLVRSAPVTTAPVTTTYVPSTVYYEPDYVVIDGVRYYSDGTTVVDEDYAPDYILPDGSRVYSVPGTVEEDFAPDYVLPDGSRVYDLNNYNYEPDYVIINGVRVYSDGSVH